MHCYDNVHVHAKILKMYSMIPRLSPPSGLHTEGGGGGGGVGGRRTGIPPQEFHNNINIILCIAAQIIIL